MQKHPQFLKIVLTASFALFAMFFGSGNLVFPLALGIEAQAHPTMAMLGLFLTGIAVPMMGLVGVILFGGSRKAFLERIGKVPAFALALVMLALLGPIGVIPRCIIVAHGGVSALWPAVPLWGFSAVFCVVTLLLVWQHDRVLSVIGRGLTPALIAGIIVLIIAGIASAPAPAEVLEIGAWSAFSQGFAEGYQTMDLLAAFFFSATVYGYLQLRLGKHSTTNELARTCTLTACSAAFLLGLVYAGFVFLGAHYAEALQGVAGERLLATIAHLTLGPVALPVVAVTMTLACLTTATALSMLFADFFQEEVCRGWISNHISLFLTLAVSFVVSLVGFEGLRAWLGSILTVAYPALIVLTIASIVEKRTEIKIARVAFWLALLLVLWLEHRGVNPF